MIIILRLKVKSQRRKTFSYMIFISELSSERNWWLQCDGFSQHFLCNIKTLAIFHLINCRSLNCITVLILEEEFRFNCMGSSTFLHPPFRRSLVPSTTSKKKQIQFKNNINSGFTRLTKMGKNRQTKQTNERNLIYDKCSQINILHLLSTLFGDIWMTMSILLKKKIFGGCRATCFLCNFRDFCRDVNCQLL